MTVRKDRLDLAAVLTLLVCCAFWGAQQVLVKATLVELAPLFQAGMRFIGALALLLAWCAWRRVALFERDGTLAAGLLAGVLFSGEFAALYLGLAHTAASRVTVFLYTAPFWVALLVPLLVPAERLGRTQWLGLAFAFLAVAFALRDGFVGAGAAGRPGAWRGDLLGLAAGLMWGLTTVAIRVTRLARAAPEKMLLYQVGVAALALPLLSIALGERWHWDWSAFAATSMALQTLVGAFASYLAWMWLLARYPATRVSAFTFLTPIFTLVFGALALGEPVTPTLVLALALVAAGMVLVNRERAPRER